MQNCDQILVAALCMCKLTVVWMTVMMVMSVATSTTATNDDQITVRLSIECRPECGQTDEQTGRTVFIQHACVNDSVIDDSTHIGVLIYITRAANV